MVWIPGMARVMVKIELVAGIEPVETIGHHQARLMTRTYWLGLLVVEE